MPITISVTAETTKDLSGLILGLAGEFQTPPVKHPGAESKAKAPKAVKTKSKKEADAGEHLFENNQPEDSKKSKAKAVTKTDAQDALAKLNAEKGILVAKEVLANFGAQRLSDVDESDYELFISACMDCLASPDEDLTA